METKIAATTLVRQLNGEVEKLKEATVDLRASWRPRFHGGRGAKRWRMLGGNGEAGALLLLLLQ